MRVKPVFILVILFVLVLLLSFLLTQRSAEANVMNEIKKLNPDERTLYAIASSSCKTLEKKEKEWIVKDCKEGRYFRIFLAEDGYMLGMCTSWKTPREAFLKLKDFLPINECVNVSAEDKLLRATEFSKTYEVCGLKIIFIDECIVGVRR